MHIMQGISKYLLRSSYCIFLLMIRLYFLGLAVLFISLSASLNKKHAFIPKRLLIIKTFQILPKFYPKKTYYQIFLKIHEILPKVKLFTKPGHTELQIAKLMNPKATRVCTCKVVANIRCGLPRSQ